MDELMNSNLAKAIFQHHYDYYMNVGIETIKQQAGQIEQVSADYQGRVIFELLQNAFDKAEKNILVKVAGNSLYVANDGAKFTYVVDFDYKNGRSNRGDFQSLCSISTSTKEIATSIGNKGVGFKSAFSIAKYDYVNVFTQAEIIQNEKVESGNIGFRIYDSFKNHESIDSNFDSEIRENLIAKIKQLQYERKERGVPGYYFPLKIEIEKDIVNNFFSGGFVTVIEIPFGESNKELINLLFNEIKNIHFQFVHLKYDKDFEVVFEKDGKKIPKRIEKEDLGFFYAEIKNKEIYQLAKSAGINIDIAKVGLFINKKPEGCLFNYLPTKVSSPFKYVDFHADFQTKVDRTSINFDHLSLVGQYNRALLRACFELLFTVINNYLKNESKVTLNLKWIDNVSVNKTDIEFGWHILELKERFTFFKEITDILNIGNWQYDIASNLIASVAKRYFEQQRSQSEYLQFFENVTLFIESYSSNTQQYSIWVERFTDRLSEIILKMQFHVLPGVILSHDNEIFYKKNTDSELLLPDYLGVQVTDFEIKNKYFRKKLGIKDFEDYNEILKHFKQASYSGVIEGKLTENQQIDLLKCVAAIMENKKETYYSATHRYSRVFTAVDRKNNSVLNQAYFNISTVFLKIKGGKYKPAQLCRKSDLDFDFIDRLGLHDRLDQFLKFIGVSLDNNYFFCDERIYQVFKNGIDFIPGIFKSKEVNEKLYGEALLKNIQIINSKGEKIHPAIVNDNNYSFLKSILVRSIKSELDTLRARNYDNFPLEYLEVLFDKIKNFPKGTERLYLSLFNSLHIFLDKYLITEGGILSWRSKNNRFFIANNRQDFDLLKTIKIPLLCFYNGNEIPDELLSKKVNLEEGEIQANTSKDITGDLIGQLNLRMPYLLALISNSNLTDLNFKENSSRIKEINESLRDCKISECTELSRNIICRGAEIEFDNQSDAIFDRQTKKIYFKRNATKKVQAELLAKYLFNNTSVASVLELTFFFKEIEELENEVQNEDLALFKKLWIDDYDVKFEKFQTEILTGFVADIKKLDDKWYIYSKDYRSEIILNIFKDGALNDFELRIQNVKQGYDGLFDDFKLEIDYSLNDSRISEMITFLSTMDNTGVTELVEELKQISRSIGMEERLDEIEQLLIKSYEYNIEMDKDLANSEDLKKKIDFERKIENIFCKLPGSKKIKTTYFSAEGASEIKELNANKKKLVFQGSNDSEIDEGYLEETGASGEVQVLGYYIEQFLMLSIEKRKAAIEKIYEVISRKLGNDSHYIYKEACLEFVTDDLKLRMSLIPFFYVTLHHKYSAFDLIVYKNNNPTFVEVKSTTNAKNNEFYISIAEVNEARTEQNYEIVRVTPNEIIFMGNPIKLLEDKITMITGSNYKMRPRNFKFEFHS